MSALLSRISARSSELRLRAGPYRLTRFIFIRGLGFVYFVAFLGLADQLLPLLGSDGLTPVRNYLPQFAADGPPLFEAFVQYPTLFWFGASDAWMQGLAWAGVLLSLIAMLGFANGLILLVLWFLYLSFVQVGQLWYGFGWEMMLLELGMLSVFLGPFLDARPFPAQPPPRVMVWLIRWFTFRVMFGAGMIKLRGDPCWLDYSCLLYHFETQPNPHPLSWYFHNLPEWMLRAGVAANHAVEIVAPFFVFGPRTARRIAGASIVLFQTVLILSGNLAFLNWLTIVAALACFDDDLVRRFLPRRIVAASDRAASQSPVGRRPFAAAWAYAAIVSILSVAPVQNLFSSRQIMNTSFDRLNLVNTYGMFGSVGSVRDEIVFQGTNSAIPNEDADWVEYEWKCKPGDPAARPCWITPYHLRLDWLIWFAAMSNYERHPWVVHLIWKLLHNDPGALSLLAGNPFPDGPPRFVRVELYRYEFTDWGDETNAWWKRRRIREYLAPLSVDNERLRAYLEIHGWVDPRSEPG